MIHHRAPSRLRRLAALVAVLGLVLAACNDEPEPEAAPADDPPASDPGDDGPGDTDSADADPGDGGVHVVATTSILGDIVANLVQDDGEVSVIMPPGADPHSFEPSAADAALLRDADLVIANGLMLEEALVTAVEAAEEEGVRIFELAAKLDPIAFDGDGPHDHDRSHDDEERGHDDEGHDDDDGHAHGPEDPHVWFDPIRMADGVRLIAAEIAAVDDRLEPAEWEARAEAYATELLAVHEEIEALFAAVENRQLVTNHDALGYLAARYGFEVLGTVIPGATTRAETDPRQFAELIETVEAAQVPAVFAENTDSTRLAEQLASEVIGRGDLDVQVVRIYTDALGEPGSGAETYLGLLRTTAERIADALS